MPESELNLVNHEVAAQIRQQGLIPAPVLDEYLQKCSQSHLHLGQTLVKDGHLKMSQLAKIIQALPGKSKKAATTNSSTAASPDQAETKPAADKSAGLVGSQFGNYEIMAELGRGGMGVVYRARHLVSGDIVALKLLLSGPGADNAQVKRFLREVKATAGLQHPNIVPVYDSGEEKGYHYFTMKHLTGGSFDKIMAKPEVPLDDKIEILVKICQALAHAHSHKIIHRDLKPSNILFSQEAEPYLTDFGVAKMVDSTSRLTQTGTAVGTPFYMSPEQVQGDKNKIGPHSDVYSVGVILYLILTGTYPFMADVLPELYRKISEDDPVRPTAIAPDIPPALEAICLMAMQKRPKFRYASAQAMADDLERFLAGEKVEAQKLNLSQLVDRGARRYRKHMVRLVWVVSLALIAGIGLSFMHINKTKRWQAAQELKAKAEQLQLMEKEIQRHYDEGMARLGDSKNADEAAIYLEQGQTLLAAELVRRQTQKINIPHELKNLEEKFPPAIFEANFRANNYPKAYLLGTELLAGTHSLLTENMIRWQMAQSAYRCELLEKALEEFGRLEKLYQADARLRAAQEHLLVGSLYYQGLIYFQQDILPKARQKLQAAIQKHQQQPENYPFVAPLYLYYCASLLADIDEEFASDTALAVKKYLELARPQLGEEDFFRETEVRYLAQLALKSRGEEAAGYARTIIALVGKCLANGYEKADLYYVRGKAHEILEEYGQSKNDYTTALYFNVELARFSYFAAKIEMMGKYLQASEMQNYYLEFLRDVDKSIVVQPNLFAKEFAKLRRHYLSKQLGITKGIEFSREKFEEFYQMWESQSTTRQEVAELALGSMAPATPLLAALQEKIGTHASPPRRQELQKLCQKIELVEQRRQMHKLLALLAQTPAEGKILNLRLFLEPAAIQSLLKIIASDDRSVFIKFLAARVLTQIPDLKLRQELWQLYTGTNNLGLKIILARAFHEIHLVTSVWDTGFIEELKQLGNAATRKELLGIGNAKEEELTAQQEEEYLLVLLAQTLSRQDKNGIPIWEWLLRYNSARVKGMAASLWNLPLPEVIPLLTSALQDGIASNNLEIQTWALATLAKHGNSTLPETRKAWRKIIETSFFSPALMQKLYTVSATTPQLLKAALYFWCGAAPLVLAKPETKEKMFQHLRNLWKSTDPGLRCHALMTSSSMWDMEVFISAFEKNEFSLLERWAVWVGALRSQNMDKENKRVTKILFSLLKDPKESYHLRGGLLYILTRFGNNNIQNSMEQAVIEHILLDALKSTNPILRMWALVSISHLAKVSARTMDIVRKIYQEHKDPNIRGVAMGALLDIYFRYSSKELEPLHAYVKKQKEGTPDDHRWAAIWGYTFTIENGTTPTYEDGREMNWEPEQIWEYYLQELLFVARRRNKTADFILRLERTLDLVQDTNLLHFLQTYSYWLAMLYTQEKQHDKALDVLEKGIAKLGRSNTRLTRLWTQLMVETGRSQEARSRLESLLAGIGTLPAGSSLEAMWQQALYAGEIRRNLALVYLSLGRSEPGLQQRTLDLLQEQWLLLPQQPRASHAVAEYYYVQNEFAHAVSIWSETAAHFPTYAVPYLGLARVYMRTGDMRASIRSLDVCGNLHGINYYADVTRYPEFKILEDNPDFRATMQKNNVDK